MTPTAVGLVLVEGEDADGEIMQQDGFDVPTRRGAMAISTSDYVAGTMSRTRALAHGRRPHTIGVTWAEDSEAEASLLLKSLSDAGYDNVVAVRCEEAGEALARGIGRAVGYAQTAVCLLEPDAVVVSMVDTHDGAVQTVGHDEHATEAGLIDWLIRVFEVNEWRPECLIVVGPDADLVALTGRLESALSIPVFAPPQADLALARGAALASARIPESTFDDADTDEAEPVRRPWPLPYTAALTMLAVGVLTFVVSIAFAAGLRLTSNSSRDAEPVQPPATQQAPAVAEAVPSAAPSAVPPVGIAPSTVPALEPITTPEEQVTVSDVVPAEIPQDAAGEVVSAPEATEPEFVPPPAPDAPHDDPAPETTPAP